ncbi:kinetechore (Skp1p-like) protein-like [Arabidopsis thaliana]|nr:kinetechore (Skp1p-like) protein-like [Arabidopsis thaliana]
MSSNKIVLTSSDGESFQVEEVVARKLQIVKHLLEDDCVINEIPLQNVTGNILSIVLEYCKKHVDDVVDDDASEEPKGDDASEEAKQNLDAWDAEFMKNIDMETIFKLILAANYLNVEGLLGLTCQTVADYIKDKTPEEVRELFNIENDFTHEEEEEAIRKENAWAFEADTKHEDPKP